MPLLGVDGELRDISPLRNLKLSQSMLTEFKTRLKPLEHPGYSHLGKEVFQSSNPYAR